MYQRKLAPAEEVVRRQFGASVQETQLRLEKDLLARMLETRHPGSGRTCHLRLEAPWHLRTARPWAPEQGVGLLAPAVRPCSLSESPLITPAPHHPGSPAARSTEICCSSCA